MSWTPKTRTGKALALAAFIGGSITAIMAGWKSIGFPTLATGMDIQRLDRQQAETAVETYQNKIFRYLLIPEPTEPVQRQFLREELEKARRQLDAAEKRKFELSR